jgi:DnaK suppressor protein
MTGFVFDEALQGAFSEPLHQQRISAGPGVTGKKRRLQMNKDQLDYFKERLQQMEIELLEDLGGKSEATAPVQLDSSIGRLSRMDAIQSQQIALGLKARQQQALLRVRSALEAIRSGSYGLCRRCKAPISIDRLEAQPDAVACVQCAENASKR